MSPTIRPGSRSKEMPSSATIPPKPTATSRTDNKGVAAAAGFADDDEITQLVGREGRGTRKISKRKHNARGYRGAASLMAASRVAAWKVVSLAHVPP